MRPLRQARAPPAGRQTELRRRRAAGAAAVSSRAAAVGSNTLAQRSQSQAGGRLLRALACGIRGRGSMKMYRSRATINIPAAAAVGGHSRHSRRSRSPLQQLCSRHVAAHQGGAHRAQPLLVAAARLGAVLEQCLHDPGVPLPAVGEHGQGRAARAGAGAEQGAEQGEEGWSVRRRGATAGTAGNRGGNLVWLCLSGCEWAGRAGRAGSGRC